jgi:hypothetical protein
VAYDFAGKRLLSAAERRGRQLHSPMDEGEVCSCCIVVSIPPHTMQVVDYGNLSAGYRLSPGSYFVIPAYLRAQTLEARPSRQSIPPTACHKNSDSNRSSVKFLRGKPGYARARLTFRHHRVRFNLHQHLR